MIEFHKVYQIYIYVMVKCLLDLGFSFYLFSFFLAQIHSLPKIHATLQRNSETPIRCLKSISKISATEEKEGVSLHQFHFDLFQSYQHISLRRTNMEAIIFEDRGRNMADINFEDPPPVCVQKHGYVAHGPVDYTKEFLNNSVSECPKPYY